MSAVRNPRWGEIGEIAASRRWDLRRVDDSDAAWHDAEFVDDLATDLTGTIYPAGTPVEVKIASYRVIDAGSSRRGRIKAVRRNHDRLVEADGAYVIGVYDPNSDPSTTKILALRLLDASTVDAILGDSWASCTRSGDEAATAPWSRFMDPQEVEI